MTQSIQPPVTRNPSIEELEQWRIAVTDELETLRKLWSFNIPGAYRPQSGTASAPVTDRIVEGDSSVEVVDLGAGTVVVTIDGTTRGTFSINGLVLEPELIINDDAVLAPLRITERDTAPSSPSAHSLYIDDGSNTDSGEPGWRRWTGTSWEDINEFIRTVSTDHFDVTSNKLDFSTGQDTNNHVWQCSFLEQIDFTVSSAGGVITGSLEKETTGDLTMYFSDEFTTLDCTPACTIVLTAGTDTVPVTNFVYIPQSTKVLTVSTSDWPSGVEHIRVANVILRSAATTQTDGALGNRNWNDFSFGIDDPRGHGLHIAERLRQEHSAWKSGTALTVTGSGTGTVTLDVTTGLVYQLHKQTFPALDMAGGDDLHIVNQFGNNYQTTADMVTDITDDATGAAIGVNRYFNLVIWGVINRTGETSHLMCNIPGGVYVLQNDAETDVQGHDVFDIPTDFKGLGFLIGRLTFRLTGAGATWTLISASDLRGLTPSQTAGSGIGVNITAFADNQFEVFDDGDLTKKLNFDLSSVTTGNTRTLTVPDFSGTLGAFDGASGGQTLVGGTDSGDVLTLQSNSSNDGVVELSDAITLPGSISPAEITGDQDDYDPTGLSGATVLRLSSDSNRAITGLAGGIDGRIVIIYNVGAQKFRFTNEDAASTAANRFSFVNTRSVMVFPNDGVIFRYDGTESRWHTISRTPPLFNKGDLLVGTESGPFGLPIGSNDQLLTADSGEAAGVKWAWDVLDEDDLVSDSDTSLATQQSIKAYIDAAATPPGGSDTQVQFNDGGSFGGDAGLVYNKATNLLSIVSGGLDLGEGNITNCGDVSLDTISADGTDIVLNESGADVDIRAESVGQVNAFFIRGSDGFVGMRTDTPSLSGNVLEFKADVNGPVHNAMYNPNAGNRALANFILINSAFTLAALQQYGGNFTPSGTAHADGTHFFSNGSGGFSIESRHNVADSGLRFYTGATEQERIKIFAGGSTVFNPNGDNAATTEIVEIMGSASQSGALLLLSDASGNHYINTGDGLTGSEFRGNVQNVDIDLAWEGSSDAALFLLDAGNNRANIGTTASGGKLHVDQNSASAAIPVLVLDQGDIDDQFINFIGTSAADGSRSISSDTTEDSAKFGAVRIEINGVTKWVRIYDDES